ncbi:hypothetical protein [Thermoanaerobacter siderophilus]|uniref:hypothetical protein n=1 Tax=Thermoanaerobacter siderophilus TaxID=106578 RepID=UPI000315B270|nr:hypothetical protein [Thermoanaerobacter siderophilus]
MIQGAYYILWQDVAKVIEENLNNFSVSETINRILFKEKEKEEVNFEEYRNEIKKILGTDAFDYLEEIDRTYLTSSCYLVKNEIKLPEYSPVIMPLFKGFEGYFRKIIYDLDFYPKAKIDKYWRIGNIFDRGKGVMKDQFKDKINNEIIINQLEELFGFIKQRDDIFHSGIPTFIYVDDFEDAVEYYKNVLNIIHSSYKKIKQFLI